MTKPTPTDPNTDLFCLSKTFWPPAVNGNIVLDSFLIFINFVDIFLVLCRASETWSHDGSYIWQRGMKVQGASSLEDSHGSLDLPPLDGMNGVNLKKPEIATSNQD